MLLYNLKKSGKYNHRTSEERPSIRHCRGGRIHTNLPTPDEKRTGDNLHD